MNVVYLVPSGHQFIFPLMLDLRPPLAAGCYFSQTGASGGPAGAGGKEPASVAKQRFISAREFRFQNNIP
jgi:hypothetical protein